MLLFTIYLENVIVGTMVPSTYIYLYAICVLNFQLYCKKIRFFYFHDVKFS